MRLLAFPVALLLVACGGSAPIELLETRTDAAPDTAPDTARDDADVVVDGDRPDAPPAGPLAPSDLSILFPLPSRVTSASLLRLDGLLSRAQFDALGAFAPTSEHDGNAQNVRYELFRVVGLRFDPCFPSLGALDSAPSTCRRQIRLVAQPIFDRIDAGTSAGDSAIHLFYDLDDETFRAVVADLIALRAAHGAPAATPIGTHPTLIKEGERGPYGDALRAMISSRCTPKALSRVAFMRGFSIFTWDFGSFDVREGRLSPVTIHGLGPSDHRGGLVQSTTANGPLLGVGPKTADSQALSPLFGEPDCDRSLGTGCNDMKISATGEALRAAYARALEIEDPTKKHADEVDCGSCHIAGPVRGRLEAMGRAPAGVARFTSPWPTAAEPGAGYLADARRFRAFGYFDSDPLVAQRTANESAAIAAAIAKIR